MNHPRRSPVKNPDIVAAIITFVAAPAIYDAVTRRDMRTMQRRRTVTDAYRRITRGNPGRQGTYPT